MRIEFFMPMIPPTATHQEKKWRVVKGKPVSYDPPEDDNVELCGAINDEVGAYNGTTVYLTPDGILQEPECGRDDCPHFAREREKARTVKAVWHDKGGPCWTFETDIPHETFTVMEDGEPFCVGIVFSMEALKEVAYYGKK